MWFLFFAFLFSIQSIPRIWTDSPYTDETWETTTGFYYWFKGEVIAPLNQPPLAEALEAFPLLFMDLKIEPGIWNNSENRAYSLHYVSNLQKLNEMIIWPRLIAFIFVLGTGFLLFLWARSEENVVYFFALLLWAFEPNLLAFSIVSKADAIFSFFCVASLMIFLKGQKEYKNKWDFLAGVLVGMAATSKLTALCLLPIYLTIDLWEVWKKPGFLPNLFRRWLVGIAGFMAAVFLIFLPGTLMAKEHWFPFTYFYQRVAEAIRIPNELNILHMPYFFCGKSYSQEQLWQFPVILALKSTTPFIILLLVAIFAMISRKVRVPFWILFFPLAWILLLHVSPSINLRYILPAYPTLILIASKGAGWLWELGEKSELRVFRKVVVFLGIWTVISTAVNFPHYAGYFNDFIVSEKKWKLLDYHYIDLNQDLKRLGKVAGERHWNRVKLVYAGQDDPFYYGLPIWEPWTLRDLQGPQAGYTYVVQASFLMAGSSESDKIFPIRHCWAARVKPTGMVGETWFYYEMPGVPEKDHSLELPSTPYLVYQNAPYRKPMGSIEKN